jgi:hypothetical protein
MCPLLASTQYTHLQRDPVAARAALGAALRRIDAAGGWGWPDDRNPFPGLRPFDVDQHRVFFGRAAEIEALAGLLRSPAERAGGSVLRWLQERRAGGRWRAGVGPPEQHFPVPVVVLHGLLAATHPGAGAAGGARRLLTPAAPPAPLALR